jgi:opacity protein-like surface antigen
MNRFVLAVFVLAVSAVSASAADLAPRPYTKAPPPVVAAYDWSGFYIGANGGGAWSRKCWDVDPYTIDIGVIPAFTVSGPEGCHTASGATAGGQIGYRWQQAAWVFGLEAQGNWAGLTGSNPSEVAVFSGFGKPHQDQCHRPVHRSARLRLERFPALRQGWRGSRPRQIRKFPHCAAGSAARGLRIEPGE